MRLSKRKRTLNALFLSSSMAWTGQATARIESSDLRSVTLPPPPFEKYSPPTPASDAAATCASEQIPPSQEDKDDECRTRGKYNNNNNNMNHGFAAAAIKKKKNHFNPSLLGRKKSSLASALSDWFDLKRPNILNAMMAMRMSSIESLQFSRNQDMVQNSIGCSSSSSSSNHSRNDEESKNADHSRSLTTDIAVPLEQSQSWPHKYASSTITPSSLGPLHSSHIVYRYYGKSRTRRTPGAGSSGSIPMVLLGPNVDHFKPIGEELASRGISVMACERISSLSSSSTASSASNRSTRRKPQQEHLQQQQQQDSSSDGGKGGGSSLLIEELIEALKWNKVVLVGCDAEAVVMVQAALKFADSGRVAGLVLCGDLTALEEWILAGPIATGGGERGMNINRPSLPYNMNNNGKPGSSFIIDFFLQKFLSCPFTIVWAGDTTALPLAKTNYYHHHLGTYNTHTFMLSDMKRNFERAIENRSMILGGGVAPHRRRPELFAWVLTRFVEERIIAVASNQSPSSLLSKRGGQQDNNHQQQKEEEEEIEESGSESSFVSSSPSSPSSLSPSSSAAAALAVSSSSSSSSVNPTSSPSPESRPVGRLVNISELLSTESFIVSGRMVATMIFYWAVMKVGIHQFDNLCVGMSNIQSAVKQVKNWKQAFFRCLGRMASQFGSLFLITSYTGSSNKEKKNAVAAGATASQEENHQTMEDSAQLKSNPVPTESAVADSDAEPEPADELSLIDSDSPPEETLQEPDKWRPFFFLDNVVA